MKKKRRIPRNLDCLLTKKERTALCEYLDRVEWDIYRPYKQRTSAYAHIKVEEYDEVEILCEVFWGVDGEWHERDILTIDRTILLTSPYPIIS